MVAISGVLNAVRFHLHPSPPGAQWKRSKLVAGMLSVDTPSAIAWASRSRVALAPFTAGRWKPPGVWSPLPAKFGLFGRNGAIPPRQARMAPSGEPHEGINADSETEDIRRQNLRHDPARNLRHSRSPRRRRAGKGKSSLRNGSLHPQRAYRLHPRIRSHGLRPSIRFSWLRRSFSAAFVERALWLQRRVFG
jgi:hypothetical protein